MSKRKQRRRQAASPTPSPELIERRLRKLMTDDCSVCGTAFRHNSRTVGGLDARGNVVLAGECCAGQVTKVFTTGCFSNRNYDFLLQPGQGDSAHAQIEDGIAAFQKLIAYADEQAAHIERYGGIGTAARRISLLDSPWKSNDRDWFEQHPDRSHRARMPFPGELTDGGFRTKAPAEHAMIMLVRQVDPGNRLKTGFYLCTDMLPVPDDEAIAHALFEMAANREPVPPSQGALDALIEKYTAVADRPAGVPKNIAF